jgi:hypothetical protein
MKIYRKGIYIVVLGMGADKFYKRGSALEVKCHNGTLVITLDTEYHALGVEHRRRRIRIDNILHL